MNWQINESFYNWNENIFDDFWWNCEFGGLMCGG
jgi:hypothetical protein